MSFTLDPTPISFTATYAGKTVNLANGFLRGRNYFEFYSYRKDVTALSRFRTFDQYFGMGGSFIAG